jgi:hypothetical protein
MRSIGDLVWLVLVPAVLVGALLSLDLPQELAVVRYEDGKTPLYLDRPYANAHANAALAGQRVVPVPRHLRFEVVLELSAPARVTRLLSDENDRAPFAGWVPEEALRIEVPGRSSTLTRAVSRDFRPGTARLAPGGPIAASPILVASAGEVRAHTTASWNKLTPGPGLALVTRNKTKLAMLTLAYGAWLLAAWRLMQHPANRR